ncbi:MAG: leucine-rich repeat domain-containing protein [Bacteroidales bacterium]|nr:leucine-rich repeat domain-containing protein [Bacteroidales bacterium]
MKRTLLLICTLLCANVLSAQTRFWVDSLQYEVTSTNPAEVEVYYANSSITTAIIPTIVTYQGITYDVTAIGNDAFEYRDSLTSIDIPNSITSIGDYTFYDCSSLTSVTIPNSVTSIGNHAFSGCSSLTSVTIPNSVTSIGSCAFSYCSNLTTLNFNAINCNDLAGSIPSTFGSNITTINIGDSVQRIPAYFAYHLNSLTSIDIPNNVTSIGNHAFWDCSNLTSVTIPNSVTAIGDAVFMDCNNLTSVTIGNGVTSIGNKAFWDCSSLTSIDIPNSVTTIGESAFEDCSSLTLLNIGSGVNHIGRNAFAYCNFLLNVNCSAVNPPTIFDNTSFPYPNSASLTVPCGSLEAYSNPSTLWNVFFNNRIYENGFDVNVSSNNTLAGHVEIESNCELAVLTAIANSGYRFVNWSDGHTENPRIIELQGDTTLIANFDIIISGAELSATICEGASLNFGGINITNSGVYTQTFTAVNGTDSIVTLTVTVNPSYNIVIDTILNEGDVYTENGFNESEIGTYVQYFQTIEGCDSIITLNILSNVSLLDVEYEEISFFPNPTKSEITFSQAIEKIEVIDLTGKAILTFTNAKTINIESLPAGAYYLRLTNEEKTSLQKVIKQ